MSEEIFEEPQPLTVLIADDHQLFRDGLKSLINRAPDMSVVGEASTGEEAVAKAGALQPDVILMDIKMPGMNGIEATRRIVQGSPHIKVLVITMFEDDTWVFDAMRAGARGYLLKGAGHREVLSAVRSVGAGGAIFSAGIAGRLMDFFTEMKPAQERQLFPELSDREVQVLGLIAHGCKNQEIADRLGLTMKTVRNHVSNILSKLQVADRAQAMIRAREAGLA